MSTRPGLVGPLPNALLAVATICATPRHASVSLREVRQIDRGDFGAFFGEGLELLAIAGERAHGHAVREELARNDLTELASGADDEDSGLCHVQSRDGRSGPAVVSEP